MSSQTFKLRLPDTRTGHLPPTGFAVVFQRTRFTIRAVHLDPPVKGMEVRLLHDRGVHVTAALPPQQRDYQLTIHFVGQPVVVRDRYLVVTGRDLPKPREGWTFVPETDLEELANPTVEIRSLREALQ
jgi:hypothetical protein